MKRLCDWWLRVKAKKDDALSDIRASKALFEESVMSANAAGTTYNQAIVSEILAQFNKLETELGHAQTATQIDQLIEQASSLAGHRAYVCPPQEIEVRGQTALNTMREWSVPSSALEALKKDIAHG